MTNAAAVETLKVFARLEPVPETSMNFCLRVSKFAARSRITVAIPANSSAVSPFAASATRAAALLSRPPPPAPRPPLAARSRRFRARLALRRQRDQGGGDWFDARPFAVEQSAQKIRRFFCG